MTQSKISSKVLEKSGRILFKLSALFILPIGVLHASDFLVDTKWLQQNLNNPNVRIVEVSVNPGQFERGHIPGAVNFRWHTDLVDTVRRDVATASNFQNTLRKAGINKDTTVVLYGDNNNWFAAWGAWVFDLYGVKNVKLLDGGRTKWEADKLPLSARASTYKVGNITINNKTNNQLRARLVDVIQASNKKSAALVDIRSADEFNGKVFAPAGVQELSIRAGHIPNAVNVPWGEAVAADGTFKSKEELRKIYAKVGIDGSKPIITYCRIGERSSHTWFALSKILGYNVKNYDGSWTEYGNTVGLPITNNAGTVWGAI
ncbi:sulfurtransferase [Acinetobacter puyangensis]|uniref:Sulfurtransferase n=1 Tax=Acinetobacter puyangensis TaxID=1096779 RepID=A0A240E5J7_9GAMM|nr:sulfurtransferase [Acinetobacter puyangensis]SNX43533.1 thiosulfate/3-mercaptopyruvate sulfurtransferase [Acinetobacter puyangensis]